MIETKSERTFAEEVAVQILVAALAVAVAYWQGRLWGLIGDGWETKMRTRWRESFEAREDPVPAWRFTEVMDDARAITRQAVEDDDNG